MKKIVSEKIRELEFRKQELLKEYQDYGKQLTSLIKEHSHLFYHKESVENLKERISVKQLIVNLEIYSINYLLSIIKERFGV